MTPSRAPIVFSRVSIFSLSISFSSVSSTIFGRISSSERMSPMPSACSSFCVFSASSARAFAALRSACTCFS